MADSKHNLTVEGLQKPKHSSKTLTLTIHDEGFSKHEVLLNESLLQNWKLKNGAPLRLSATAGHPRRNSTLNLEGKHQRQGSTRPGDVILVFTYQELSAEVLSKYPNLEISVSQNIASSLGLVNRSLVLLSQVGEDDSRASHVEVVFRDAYLTRADMWRLVCSELAGKALYKGQKITFLNAIRAQVKSIYHQENKVTSALFASSTKPIFRSESARYVIFLQMSKEMWEFEPEGSGEIMFNKVIDGFLPELFRRWSDSGARHLISIVLFTRMEYPAQQRTFADYSKDKANDEPPYRDFYRVLTSNMESGHHEAVLTQLKKDFKTFLRDISVRPATESDRISLFQDGLFSRGKNVVDTIQGRPAPATRGNILEAINTASSQFSEDYIDRDLLRTGLSIVIVTPGPGIFEVDAGLLNLTTDFLIENGVGIDLVCLARMPLHSVPLFKYRRPRRKPSTSQTLKPNSSQKGDADSHDGSFIHQPPGVVRPGLLQFDSNEESQDSADSWNYAIPHWLDISFWTPKSTTYSHKNAGIRSFTPSKVKPFLTRVKMYEIQMMGIMENETNSVSIPYLDQYQRSDYMKDSKAGLDAPGPYSSSMNLRNTGQMSSSFGTKRSDSISISHSPRSPNHINSAKKLSHLVHWMEDFDNKVFKIYEPPAAAKLEAVRPLPIRSQTVGHVALVTSGQPEAVDKTHATESTVSRKPPLLGTIPSKSSTSVITKKTSNASMFRNNSNALGSFKGNRPTATGFKGFANLATKASASIELSSETAHRESLLTQALKSLPTPARLVTPEPAPAPVQDEKRTPRTSTDEERTPSRPISPVAKPISIRKTGKEIFEKQEQNSLISNFDGSITPRRNGDVNLMKVPSRRTPLMRALAPWFTILNPSHPKLTAIDPSSRLGRWHHVFPRPLHASTIKWKSLCAPASIPLTTEGFPSAEQLASEYDVLAWSVSESTPSPAEKEAQSEVWLFREILYTRFSNGYQVVVGSQIADVLGDQRLKDLDIFNDDQILVKNSPIYMSRGVQIHRLTLLHDNTVEVKQFTRIRGHGIADELGKKRNLVYTPFVKTSLGLEYEQRKITISTSREAYDWNRLDTFIAGHEQEQECDIPEELKYWRARYILIPMQPSVNLKKVSPLSSEDNEEEIRLEGLYRLTQMWQKSKYMPVKEAHQRVVARASADSNPLDIIFRTKPPSMVVASELHDSLLEKGSGDGHPRNLLPESELLSRPAIDLKLLAQLLQGEKGIKMQNRRWHLRLHDYCFIGLEFVTWLVDNFRDIDNREVAVEFGEQLMKEGLFIHVEKRHNFRDGNFFYQISPEYKPQKPPATWLSKLSSVPSTPIAENRYSPKMRPQSSDEDTASEEGTKTPTEKSRTTKVLLSKKLIYDVDRRRKSYRREIINLHYDRVSSADDCYHIRINWLNVTPKLVEDAVSSWASAVERYGLRLVEIPIMEASRVNELHTFRSPYIIKLAKQPPEYHPRNSYDTTASSAKQSTIRFPYHKALLKKFNFVLDLEAARDFPDSVDVMYSWGKPDYDHPQFISRDGVLLAQIMDDGNFLLLANRLSSNRHITHGSAGSRPYSTGLLDGNLYKSTTGTSTQAAPSSSSILAQHPHTKAPSLHLNSPHASPFASPMIRATPDVALALAHKTDMITPVTLKEPLEQFCANVKALEQFYEEVSHERNSMPSVPNTPNMEALVEGRVPLAPVPTLRDSALSGARK